MIRPRFDSRGNVPYTGSMNTRRQWMVGAAAALVSVATAVALAAPAKKPPAPLPPHKRPPPTPIGLTLQLKLGATDGFFDDAIAFSRDGARIAVVHTDGQTYNRVEIFDIAAASAAGSATPPPTRTIDLSPFTQQPAELAFLADGQTLFVKERLVVDGVFQPARAQLYKPDGTVLRAYGPVTDLALTEIAGVEAVVTYKEKPGKKGMSYEIVATRADNGKNIVKRALAADAEDFVKSADLRISFFSHHYLQVHGRQKGAFDKAKDMRLPDRAATYDVVAGKITASADIGDLREAQRLMLLRKNAPDVAAFVRVADDLSHVELITATDRAAPVTLADDMVKYDPRSARDQLSPDQKQIYFSLTIDPVNLVAVDKKIADIEYIDLYRADAETGTATRLGRLPALGRPFGWRVSGDQWAVLRKHKGFSRGGPDLELYKVTAK